MLFRSLALMLWLVAFAVVASQSCLTSASHHQTAVQQTVAGAADADPHALACLQQCAATTLAMTPALQLPMLGLPGWTLLLPLLLVLLTYPPAPKAFAYLTLRRPAPPRPPARLSFVRFND